MLLRVEDLSVQFGPITALQDVGLDVDFGQIVAVTGDHGSGRSTLLQAISGLISPTAGRITWAAGDQHPTLSIGSLPPHERVELGIAHVPQERGIVPELSVRNNLLLGAHQRTLKPAIHADIADCYERFSPLESLDNHPAGSLRAHEQQMLALCRALMSRPRLLLVDEPARGLSPEMSSRLSRTFRHLRNEGLSILLTDSNPRRAAEVADVVSPLNAGRIARSIRPPASRPALGRPTVTTAIAQ